MAESNRSPDEVAALLARIHPDRAAAIRDVEPIAGGFWSSAFSYRLGDDELVLRLGDLRSGYDMDAAAHAFSRPELPVPEVLEIGPLPSLDAGDGFYAVSRRHHGRFLEDASPDEAERVGPAIVGLLDALRETPVEPIGGSTGTAWTTVEAGAPTWRQQVRAGMTDDPARHVSGWRALLAADPAADRLFRACEDRIDSLLDACPERRDLVHSDLLHQNVLVDDDARVTAVFSWKCAMLGDFLYDAAWFTHWAPYHPGIEAADVWTRVTRSLLAAGRDDLLVDAGSRHHCYELQVGAHHLGWYAWTDDPTNLAWQSARLDEILERGPLALPART